MMKPVLIFVFCIASLTSFCQEINSHNYYWNGTENYEAMIEAANCYVRENPSVSATLVDSLQAGKEVTVIKSAGTDMKLKGINVSWVQVQYQNKEGALSTGFLWKGFLAVGFAKKGEHIYLTSIDKIEMKRVQEYEGEYFSITVKVLNADHKLLDQKTIEKSISESAYFEGKVLADMGLTNVQDIYRISFNGEACAIPSLFYYFGWNGKQLLLLPEKYSVSDAGSFYHSENFIFPKEKGGKPGLIIKQIEEAVNEEETGDVFSITESSELYTWDGEKAVFLKKETGRKYKRKG